MSCGSKYTWTNKRKGKAMIEERLDRFFENSDWLSLFPKCYVRHLARMHSDHSPPLLETDRNIRMKPPFRYIFGPLTLLSIIWLNLSGQKTFPT